jgi:hypothetical protein
LFLADKKVATSPSKGGQKESTEGGKRKEAKRKKILQRRGDKT